MKNAVVLEHKIYATKPSTGACHEIFAPIGEWVEQEQLTGRVGAGNSLDHLILKLAS